MLEIIAIANFIYWECIWTT